MTNIYLIRHCEAEGNLYRRVQGQTDGKATVRGMAQIARLAERFREVPLDALYASDLSRAVTTAGAIRQYHDLALVTVPALREIDMGVWENIPWGNAERDEPEMLALFSADPERWHVEGAESFPAFSDRIHDAILAIAQRHEGQSVAVIGHGMAIRTLLCRLLGIPSEETMRIAHADNTAVNLLHLENGRLTVEYYNDNSHLDDYTSTFSNQNWWKDKSGSDHCNLSFSPLDENSDRQLYIDCYADAWRAAHGSLEGFSGSGYWNSAKRHLRFHPECVMKAWHGRDFAGLIDLSPDRPDAGWVSLCYIVPELRGQHYGIQLIGHAVTFFRDRGRKVLRLHVAESNTHAIFFYENNGFQKIGEDRGMLGKLHLMELKL